MERVDSFETDFDDLGIRFLGRALLWVSQLSDGLEGGRKEEAVADELDSPFFV